MTPFIRITEVWVPSSDGTKLTLAGGLFGDAADFAMITRDLSFGRGEGLPGQAWQEGRPVLLKDFDSLHFKRGPAARALSLQCAVALPVFVQDRLTGVLVFFCGDASAGDDEAGALELWHNDPRLTTDMTLVDGHYGGTPGAFESLSRDTFLPRGSGLPGLAWQREAAVFMEDLASAPRFLRGETAVAAGIRRGLALPCGAQTRQSYVLTLLSAARRPIARRMESWVPDEAAGELVRAFGFCEGAGRLAEGEPLSHAAPNAAHDAAPQIASAFASGVPLLGEAHVVIPLVSDGHVTEAVVLYF